MAQRPAAHNCASRLAIAGLIFSAFHNSIAIAAPSTPSKGVRAATPDRLSAEHVKWARAMRKIRPPATGCAVARYPILAWTRVACVVAPNEPAIPSKGPGEPFVVGGGGSGDMMPRTSPRTISADGSFQSVSAGITENGLVGNPGTSQTLRRMALERSAAVARWGCSIGARYHPRLR